MVMPYEHLKIALEQEIDRNINLSFLAEQITVCYDEFTPNGIIGLIHYFKQGYIHGGIGNPKNKEKKLDLLSILLYTLNFEKRYPNVIEGIKEIDDGFKYPPENNTLYNGIREVVEERKNNNLPSSQTQGNESGCNKLEEMLRLPVNLGSHATHNGGSQIRGLVRVDEFSGLEDTDRHGIKIEVTPLNTNTDSCINFEESYHRSVMGKEYSKNFTKYIESLKGEEAHVVYKEKRGYLKRVLQMIAPVSTEDLVVYARNPERLRILEPVRIVEPLLESLMRDGIIVKDNGKGYTILAPQP
jgi:hypothetical protein